MQISYIGMQTQEVVIKPTLKVVLKSDSQNLDEVVVTAMGIKRSEKSLGYAVSSVKGDEITKARESNVLNSLSGKIAGLQIAQSSGTVGGSSSIQIRGASSIGSVSSPLFIIDGLPIDNGSYNPDRTNGIVDVGNRAGDINSDDIESINVLKGAAATALYGARAKDGAIVITTKKGKKNSPVFVTVNSSTRFENVLKLPDFQNEYAQGSYGVYNVKMLNGWGPKISSVQDQQFTDYKGDKVTLKAGETKTVKASAPVGGLHFWSWGYGYLYTVKTALKDSNNRIFDEVSTRTGFRKTRFAEGKVWLNDRVIQMKGYAQRTSNEWPAVGLSVPAWLSDYSNDLMVKSNANLVRWMHVTPWKQDVESCDRVGLIQAMPAGDSEKDREGRQWEQRVELMRDAIIYNRNNPSILFYECGNKAISRPHMIEMKAVRDKYDPFGGRAIGSREMLDIREAEYGGEMLYINKSEHHPMWATEYCRDEGLRKYWDEYSYPFHKEGDGPLHKGQPATDYNHNQDQLAITMINRWYDYWRERPGTGNRVSSGGTKIIFSDTNTHYRGEENYRRSGVTDAMRIEKDAFYAHQVMWNGWVDTEADQTYIIGHWNYPENTVKPVHVVSTGEDVELFLNGKSLGKGKRQYNFLFSFDKVTFKPGKLEAVSYNKSGKEISRYAVNTVGEPAKLKLTAIQNPEGFHADGADMTLIQVEIVDKDGKRCPLDNRTVQFTLKGNAEWRGGIAQGENNHILDTNLPVECGINRALIRSTTTAGKITLTAQAKGLPAATLTLETVPVKVNNGLSSYLPQASLKGRLDRGETPSTPSYKDTKRGIRVVSAKAGANSGDVAKSYDDIELSEWKNDGKLSTAWITYTLEKEAMIDDVCLKLHGWRSRSYPLEVYAGKELIWSGNTEKSLGYVHLNIEKPVRANTITIRLKGNTSDKDAFGQLIEVEAKAANKMELEKSSSKNQLRIIEAEFLETIK